MPTVTSASVVAASLSSSLQLSLVVGAVYLLPFLRVNSESREKMASKDPKVKKKNPLEHLVRRVCRVHSRHFLACGAAVF